ncbi:group III truncated hemoglobin [Ensifer sp. HO-A22]|jgi:hemoglobin|uniref:Group III truncated hemoglobin n=1 Tax=Ensifer oleiphilus TaxID=2742698 RepID=A0A7Y6QCB8_9HYPH|nr:group III truncated hemoglobin [Ensifer oleiphilus]NVD43033.1 group III truncated hemoglobin [Ensifer oleiphilus]
MGATLLPTSISEDLIRAIVHDFYDRIRRDPLLGPIFNGRIGKHWDLHLSTLVDFWSSIALRTGRYGGKPHVVHQGLELIPEHFERWLSMFEATVSQHCTGEAAGFFLDRAKRIAESLQIGLNIGPNAIKLPPKQL